MIFDFLVEGPSYKRPGSNSILYKFSIRYMKEYQENLRMKKIKLLHNSNSSARQLFAYMYVFFPDFSNIYIDI